MFLYDSVNIMDTRPPFVIRRVVQANHYNAAGMLTRGTIKPDRILLVNTTLFCIV